MRYDTHCYRMSFCVPDPSYRHRSDPEHHFCGFVVHQPYRKLRQRRVGYVDQRVGKSTAKLLACTRILFRRDQRPFWPGDTCGGEAFSNSESSRGRWYRRPAHARIDTKDQLRADSHSYTHDPFDQFGAHKHHQFAASKPASSGHNCRIPSSDEGYANVTTLPHTNL